MGAAKKHPVATAADEPVAPGMVRLYSDNVGYQDFTTAHAEALLAYQVEKGYTHWGPPPNASDKPA